MIHEAAGIKPRRPLVLGIGGTLRQGSSSERMLRLALDRAEKAGARVDAMAGAELDLPHYDPSSARDVVAARRLLERFRSCDGLIVASPGYHGSMSGMIKNALDYTEELKQDERIYLDGRAVGLIVCAYGWQAAGTTLVALRSVMHALRAWPTPLGVAINSGDKMFDDEGRCLPAIGLQLDVMAQQVVRFATSSFETGRDLPAAVSA